MRTNSFEMCKAGRQASRQSMEKRNNFNLHSLISPSLLCLTFSQSRSSEWWSLRFWTNFTLNYFVEATRAFWFWSFENYKKKYFIYTDIKYKSIKVFWWKKFLSCIFLTYNFWGQNKIIKIIVCRRVIQII